MSTFAKRLVVSVMSAMALVAGAVDTATPAVAHSAQKAGHDPCRPMKGYPTTHAFMGWCDGKGGQGKYGTYVICGGKMHLSSYVRSYGDRRGVYAACPYDGTVVGGYGFR